MAQDDTSALVGIAMGVESALRRSGLGPRIDDMAMFARLLLDSAGTDAITGYDAETLAAFVRVAYDFIAVKPPDRPGVGVSATQLPAGARTRRVATIQTLNDDMPFLVDSVMGEVQATGLAPLLVVHPIFKTRRAADGRLEAIIGPGDRNWDDGTQESYIAVILDPIDEMLAREMETRLPEVLAEVRAAVGDWRPMLASLDGAIALVEQAHGATMSAATIEALTFSRWLREGHFTFLGARRLAAAQEGLAPLPGSGLGLLRDKDGQLVQAAVDQRQASGPVVFAKSALQSRVHRRVAMDYVGIALPDGGRLELVGLLTSSAYTQSPREIPLLRQKVAAVVARSGHPPGSHAGKALLNVLESFPRDELFLHGEVQLAAWAEAVLDLDLRPRVRLLAHVDPAARATTQQAPASAIVYVPRDRYSTATGERIGQILAEAWHGRVASFTPFFPEGPLVRIHFALSAGVGAPPDIAATEARIAGTVRSWEDQLAVALAVHGDAAPALYARYRQAFTDGYRGLMTPSRAIEDIARIEALSPEKSVAIDLYVQPDEPAQRVRAAVYRLGSPIPLSERVPMLENLGFAAIEERSFTIAPAGRAAISMHDMQLETADGAPAALAGRDARLEATMLAVLAGEADNDPFNRLVLVAGLDWRQAAMLRAYAAYMRQMPSPFGPRYIADTLMRHPDLAHDLVALFIVRLDPDAPQSPADRTLQETELRSRIETTLAGVASLDEDRILRLLLALIAATVRTNYFQAVDAGMPPALAFKLDSRKLEALPEPRPYREIWVYSPRLEGIHLRFAPIARGGIRWSDRAQDFRTEVLGLAKAQQVKNAVIVPQGAKGGFLPKRLPRAGTRDEIAREGLAAYQLFIGALLDVTDNLVQGSVMPPPRVVRHDGDDPYLVVAADKGTATFSDTANGIALARGFWLGDAFASGGSAGYDHKGMGITARGAFVCIRRHFREMDRDIDRAPFSVVGVGDMSGDVFGNGVLLSRQTRLIAAFDHRDIFLDPDPDPALSFAERARLFALPRSSWQDYDKRLLSRGGGVFSRASKSIDVTPEMGAVLGIKAARLTPAELIRAILKAPCDLLWLGGIGTYIKATDESDEQVGDRANDGVRVTASEVCAKVVGEGANLGVTQRGRVELARAGGRVDTDFIDNSAGVNTSDQEVNIKIALAPAVVAGRLSAADRLALLQAMTDDVAAGALRNNDQQSLALSLVELRGAGDLGYQQRLMQMLEGRGMLDRRREALPSNAEMAQRQAAGKGLTRPELAILLSLAKIALIEDLLASDVPDRPEPRALLADYFPAELRKRFPAEIATHRLAREIVATLLTNAMINRGGPAFAVRMADETGRPLPDVAAAYLASRAALGLPEVWLQIATLDGKIKGALQLELYARVQDLLLSSTRWFARQGAVATSAAAEIARVVERLRAGELDACLPSRQAERVAGEVDRLAAAGVPQPLRTTIAMLELQADAPAIAALASAVGCGPPEAARALFAAADRLRLDEVTARAAEVPILEHFDRLALDGALASMRATAERLARRTLAGGPGAGIAMTDAAIVAARLAVDGALGAGKLTTSRLTVAAERIRELSGG